MRKKTEGLSFPADPLAAMRALSELDRPPPPKPLPITDPPEESPPAESEENTEYSERRTDVPTYQYVDVPTYRRTDVPTYQRTDVPESVDELMDCELPSTAEDALRFLNRAAEMKKEGRKLAPFTFKAPVGIESLVRRTVKEAWRTPMQKQDLFTRGLMLVLYERYTGQELVNFNDLTNHEEDEKR